MTNQPADATGRSAEGVPLFDETVYNDEELNKDYLNKKDVKAVYYFHSQTNSIFKVNVDDDALNDRIYLNVISAKAQRQFNLQNEGIVCTSVKKPFQARKETTFHLRSSVEVNEEVLIQKDASTKAWLKAQVIEFIRERREVTVEILMPGNLSRKFKMTVPFHRIAYFVPRLDNLNKAFRVVGKVYSRGGQPSYLSGRIVDLAKEATKNRFLVFFESGITSYVNRKDISVILDQSKAYELFNPFQREFLLFYFKHYPEVPMVKFKPGDQSLIRLKMPNQSEDLYVRATGVVTRVDCKLVQFHVRAYKTSVWLYRGDFTRILSIETGIANEGPRRSRPLRTLGLQSRNIIEVTIDDDQNEVIEAIADEQLATIEQTRLKRLDEAKLDIPTETVLNEIELHTCSSSCLKEGDSPPNSLNMFVIPMWYGWKRLYDIKYDHSKVVFYLAPCGVKLYEIEAIFDWLQITGSKLQIDQFNLDRDFIVEEDVSTYLGYHVFWRDISNGRERVPVSLINTINEDVLNNFEYIAEREFHPNIELELDKNFMLCCDCTDDCRNPEKCACQRLTSESMKSVHEFEELPMRNRLLYSKILSGIYECNNGCACRKRKQQCVNRNAQLGLRNKLQLFRTYDKGWGVRTLHDIPKGRQRVRNRFTSLNEADLFSFLTRLVYLLLFRCNSGQPDRRGSRTAV